jgi:predicted amidohydrolase
MRVLAMLERVRVAAAAVDSKPGELDANLEKLAAAAARAADDGAQLVLFPELSLTGFLPNHPAGDHEAWLRRALAEARRMAVPLDGPAVARLAQCALRRRIWLSAGLLGHPCPSR